MVKYSKHNILLSGPNIGEHKSRVPGKICEHQMQ